MTSADVRKVREFVARAGVEYFVGIDDGGGCTTAWMDLLGFNGLPFAAVVAGDGNVVWSGHPIDEALEDALDKIGAAT